MPTADGRLTAAELTSRVVAYYRLPDNEAGGSLHVVLDDGNYEDQNVRFCIAWARKTGDRFGERLGLKLLAASRTQRSKAAKDAHVMLRTMDKAEREDRLTCWHAA